MAPRCSTSPPAAVDAVAADESGSGRQRGCTLVPAAESGRWLVDAALAAEPGAVYAGALAELDPDGLDGETRVDLIRAWQRVAAWVDAQQQVALASVVAATEDAGLTGDDARHEVGVALRLSPGSAYDTVQRAAALTGRLADTLAALRRGEISGLQAATIATMVEHLDDDVAATVQAAVLATAPEQTLAEMKRALRRAVIAADPAGAAERAERAKAERTVSRDPSTTAMAELRAVLTATDTELVWAELTARAQAEHIRRADHGLDQPGLDALRADALVDAILGTHPDTGAGKRGRAGRDQWAGAGAAAGQHRPAHPARPRRQPGRARRARPHPAAPGPRARRGRRLDPVHHRPPNRGAARPRPPPLPALPAPRRVHPRPPTRVHLARLQPARRTLRPRPQPRLPQRRRHLPAQPRPVLPPTPQRQNPRPLALPAPPRRWRHPHQPTAQDLHLKPPWRRANQ